jgi:transcriptional regulator with XRE-family HTH domain
MSNTSDEQKKLIGGRSNRFLAKLDIAMKLAGFREIQAFADKTPYDRSFISRILHGHIKPTLEQAQDITNALGLKVSDVFDFSEIRGMDFFNKKLGDENETA